MVRSRGVEPPRVAPLAPQASASAIPPRPQRRGHVTNTAPIVKGPSNAFAIDTRVDSAFDLVRTCPPAVPITLAGRHTAGARYATDRGIAVVDQRMLGQPVFVHVGDQLRQFPLDQRIEADAALDKLNLL